MYFIVLLKAAARAQFKKYKIIVVSCWLKKVLFLDPEVVNHVLSKRMKKCITTVPVSEKLLIRKEFQQLTNVNKSQYVLDSLKTFVGDTDRYGFLICSDVL